MNGLGRAVVQIYLPVCGALFLLGLLAGHPESGIALAIVGTIFGVGIAVVVGLVKMLFSGVFGTPAYTQRLAQISRMGHRIENERNRVQQVGGVAAAKVQRDDLDAAAFNANLEAIRNQQAKTK